MSDLAKYLDGETLFQSLEKIEPDCCFPVKEFADISNAILADYQPYETIKTVETV